MEQLLWALWIVAGGPLYSGRLDQPAIQAYFVTAEECQRVSVLISELSTKKEYRPLNFRCIQAKYWIPK